MKGNINSCLTPRGGGTVCRGLLLQVRCALVERRCRDAVARLEAAAMAELVEG